MRNGFQIFSASPLNFRLPELVGPNDQVDLHAYEMKRKRNMGKSKCSSEIGTLFASSGAERWAFLLNVRFSQVGLTWSRNLEFYGKTSLSSR